MSALGQPRPIAEQTWRFHHRPRMNLARIPGTDKDRPPSATSGCTRRRRKAILRRLWVDQLADKWENR